MSQQEQIEQLQGQVMELRAIVNQLVGPAGEFLFKRDTTLGVKDTKVILGARGSRVGFFGTTPVSYTTSSGTSAAITTGPSGVSMYRDDKFDGYNFSDVVKRLKELGLMAS